MKAGRGRPRVGRYGPTGTNAALFLKASALCVCVSVCAQCVMNSYAVQTRNPPLHRLCGRGQLHWESNRFSMKVIRNESKGLYDLYVHQSHAAFYASTLHWGCQGLPKPCHFLGWSPHSASTGPPSSLRPCSSSHHVSSTQTVAGVGARAAAVAF